MRLKPRRRALSPIRYRRRLRTVALEWPLMSLAAILNEVDLQLFRLEQARDLLLQSVIPVPPGWRSPRVSKKVDRSPDAAHKVPVSRRRAPKESVRETPLSAENVVDQAVPLPEIVSAKRLSPENSASVESQMQPSVLEPPVRQPSVSTRKREQHRDRLPGRKPPVAANALSKRVPSGWVGVSAEEARRAGEQKIRQPEPSHSEYPVTAAAGRRAFEAAFGGTSETAGTATQDAALD